MRRLGLGVLLAAMVVSGQTAAEREELVVVQSGFITGNKYRNLTAAERTSYVMGWVDGVGISALFGAPPLTEPGSPLDVLSRCINGMTNRQVEAIFSKWLGEHPERWHEDSNALMFSAMTNVCHFP